MQEQLSVKLNEFECNLDKLNLEGQGALETLHTIHSLAKAQTLR
jgi:hypothetical protein